MTYRELCRMLEQAKIENSQGEAAILLERFCGCNRSLAAVETRDFRNPSLLEAVQRRIAHVPLQYVLGEWTFFREIYEVSEDCLIPRSDTEILVEEAIKRLPKNAIFADLCTGSGCIAVSTLKNRPDTQAVALDKFENTVALAKRNAVKNQVGNRLELLTEDLFGTLSSLEKFAPFDAILSNPPYIQKSVLSTLSEEVKKEPMEALDGGEDGLSFYRRLLEIAPKLLKTEGFCLFEIGYDQGDAVSKLGRESGFSSVSVKKDYGGNDRLVLLSRLDA